MTADHKLHCPSAQPDWEGAKVFGVVGGTPDAPATAYLAAPAPVTPELLAQTAPVSPDEVFRIAAPCACSGCDHYAEAESKCRLVQKIVRWVPVVTDSLPVCSIRAECRWFEQEGRAACMRCPQVVTNTYIPTAAIRDAANPELL
ncbi:MAG TPA: hypothetical protein VM553_06965 [Dongiaceae bacterium]|nr:hypothetical protein [Dongiaceae bacterium]